MKAILILLILTTPAYATTMLLRSTWEEGQTRYCVYSMSSSSEQRTITVKHYENCKRMIDG